MCNTYILVGMNIDSRTKRDPDKTREALLRAAFGEIHRSGFQAASLERILSTAGVTKGALYHHFPNKAALGYAVVDELIKPFIIERWVRPVEGADDPIQTIVDCLADVACHMTCADIELGCPLNNLMQEMSPIDEGFRQRLNAVSEAWRAGIARALARGQGSGTVREDIDPEKTAGLPVRRLRGNRRDGQERPEHRAPRVQSGSAGNLPGRTALTAGRLCSSTLPRRRADPGLIVHPEPNS